MLTVEQKAKNLVESGRVLFELAGRFHRFYQVKGVHENYEVILCIEDESKHSCTCKHEVFKKEGNHCCHIKACILYEELQKNNNSA
jgi:hypothetical protein